MSKQNEKSSEKAVETRLYRARQHLNSSLL